jgi:ATP-dependent Lon protease
MKESARAAMSYLRTHADSRGIDPKVFPESEVHIHVPAGAIPKDGPSAGIALLTALTTLFMDRPIKSRLAMTGEITLTGQVLPVGGIKEKVLAAHRAGIDTVILPDQNEKDYREDIPDAVKSKLAVHFVNNAEQVLRLALEKKHPRATK